MSTFEDHLWSRLVTDHDDQMGHSGDAIAALAAASGESSRGSRWRASGRRPRRGKLVLAITTVGIASLASAILVAHTATNSPTAPGSRQLAFAVTDNHDGSLTITLHKRSALATLNASLVSYGLKARLPRGATARTLSLTATCPKVPTLPGGAHPAAVAVGSPHTPLPGNLPRHPLKNCVLHSTS
jgi:hypothetical protein